MTDITTPAQMREAVEQAVLAEKMRMMSWCAKRQAVSRKAWERAARKALAGDMAELRNRIALIDAGPLDIVQSDAGDDALPVAEPLCTWPSCGHTAKGQCRTYLSGQMLAPNDASITATNTPVSEPERPADKIMTGLAEAKAFQDAILYMARTKFTYTNWRGETSERTIIPQSIWFGSTEWHPEPQWLLLAWDCEKQAERDFALKDFGQKPEPMAVKVKPLVWELEEGRPEDSPEWVAEIDGKRYEIFMALMGKPGFIALGEFYHTEAEAKAAVDADHAASVRSQIDAVSVAQVRAEALREGYDAGFAATTVGWNAEFGPEQTGYAETYVRERETIIGALGGAGWCGPSLISETERKAIRNRALEEAAKLPPYDGDGDPAGPFDHHVFVKRDAIRALIEREPT